jgi:hypothetical protein
MNACYEEVWMSVSAGMPEFPETCPKCGAPVKWESDGFHGPTYECLGKYRSKPQIQNHTNKWWGHCPKTAQMILETTHLLEARCTIWVVRADGTRGHMAGFSNDSIAERFARSLSADYPRFWDDENPVAYIEVEGSMGSSGGKRFCKGKLIAVKEFPNHLPRDNRPYDRVWFSVEKKSLGSYIMGDIIDG